MTSSFPSLHVPCLFFRAPWMLMEKVFAAQQSSIMNTKALFSSQLQSPHRPFHLWGPSKCSAWSLRIPATAMCTPPPICWAPGEHAEKGSPSSANLGVHRPSRFLNNHKTDPKSDYMLFSPASVVKCIS